MFEGNIPLTREKFTFVQGEVKELPPKGIMPWKEHQYQIKDRNTLIFFEYFIRPIELQNMMRSLKNTKSS